MFHRAPLLLSYVTFTRFNGCRREVFVIHNNNNTNTCTAVSVCVDVCMGRVLRIKPGAELINDSRKYFSVLSLLLLSTKWIPRRKIIVFHYCYWYFVCVFVRGACIYGSINLYSYKLFSYCSMAFTLNWSLSMPIAHRWLRCKLVHYVYAFIIMSSIAWCEWNPFVRCVSCVLWAARHHYFQSSLQMLFVLSQVRETSRR